MGGMSKTDYLSSKKDIDAEHLAAKPGCEKLVANARGICLAETFNLPTAPYQALRRGGITGEGECGAIKAGELILGQYHCECAGSCA